MFGIGIKELIVLVLVAVAVWYGYRLFERRQSARVSKPRRKKGKGKLKAEQMVECPTCGAYYLPGSPPRCENNACPVVVTDDRPGANP